MEARKFRKLNIDLPREPIVNDRVGLIAGLLIAITFLLITVYAYLKFKGIF